MQANSLTRGKTFPPGNGLSVVPYYGAEDRPVKKLSESRSKILSHRPTFTRRKLILGSRRAPQPTKLSFPVLSLCQDFLSFENGGRGQRQDLGIVSDTQL